MKNLHRILLITAVISLVFTSCNKDEDEKVIVQPPTTESDVGANDETARYEYDKTIDDLFSALNNTGLQTGKGSQPDSGVILPCGVIRIDSTGGVYKFVYDTTCGIRVLSGSISVSLTKGTTWSQAGAELEFLFTNYEIYYSKNNQTLTFNGPLYVTNATGGKLIDLFIPPFGKSITHTVSGTIHITFDQLDTRKWRIRKKRIFATSNNFPSGLTISLDQDSAVAEVGTTKTGDPFTTTIPNAIVFENCSPLGSIEGPYIATEGKLVYTTPSTTMTAEAGYVFTNNTAVLDGTCSSTGYKLTYNILGQNIVAFQHY